MKNIKEVINSACNGTTFISISTSTEPKLTGGKKNPFQGRVRKIMDNANVMLFQNKTINGYDAMVRRRLEAEGKNPDSFELSPRVWGTRIPNTPFVEHNGQYYLEVIFLKSGKVHYEVSGQPMDPAHIEGLVLDRPEGAQGGLNDKVIIRTFRLDSIVKITVNKQAYEGPFDFK